MFKKILIRSFAVLLNSQFINCSVNRMRTIITTIGGNDIVNNELLGWKPNVEMTATAKITS